MQMKPVVEVVDRTGMRGALMSADDASGRARVRLGNGSEIDLQRAELIELKDGGFYFPNEFGALIDSQQSFQPPPPYQPHVETRVQDNLSPSSSGDETIVNGWRASDVRAVSEAYTASNSAFTNADAARMDGSSDETRQSSDLETCGADMYGTAAHAQSDLANLATASEQVVVPVMEEHLNIERRRVTTGGVRLQKIVHTQEQVIDEPILQEQIEVERVPVNRFVEAPPPIRYEGEVMIVPVLEEVAVVQKRLVLREELRVAKRRVATHQPQTVTLRREEINVERFDASDALMPVANVRSEDI